MNKIYAYSDYRKFIKDFYELKKATESSFSFRHIAKKAGINSSGYYPQVLQGKRDLTRATILKTSIALGLRDEEAEYFENLVLFNQAKTLKKKNQYFERLIELQNQVNEKKPGPHYTIPESSFDYFAEWYHPAIRELAVFTEFGDDYKILARKLNPPLTEKQVRESIEMLLRLGFLEKKDGNYRQTEPVMTTGPDIKSHRVINFQIKMLKLAIEAFEKHHPDDPLSNSSTTFGISRETYEIIKMKNREYREELIKLARADGNPEHVYQMNINLFPLTRIRKKK
jgi:uncharacterized protein (TIGR02147 family)